MSFNFLRLNFNGDPNLGLYGFANDNYCILGFEPHQSILNKIKEILGIDILITTIAGTELSGLFAVGNKNGIILPKITEEFEIKKLKEFEINFKIINSKETALGNLILCNDKGCLISSSLKNYKKEIAETLDCEIEIGKIANLNIVGSCAIANNIGCLCHRDAKEEEMKIIENLLKVKVDVGSVNYGNPFIKSGIIVNSKGIIFSEQTTGSEIGRFEEVFK
ncbi:MAG: translation initiation factor IF-6 [Candidatus Aenigmatarchaeota archaeon]